MKIRHIIYILIFTFLTNCSKDKDNEDTIAQDCTLSLKNYYGDLTFTTQKELDDFNVLGYTAIRGNLDIIEDISKK